MEGTARAHGATLLRCRLLHLMQLGAGVAGPGVELGEAGQVAEALLVPWGCSLVPKSSAVPRSLEKDLSGWLAPKVSAATGLRGHGLGTPRLPQLAKGSVTVLNS